MTQTGFVLRSNEVRSLGYPNCSREQYCTHGGEIELSSGYQQLPQKLEKLYSDLFVFIDTQYKMCPICVSLSLVF